MANKQHLCKAERKDNGEWVIGYYFEREEKSFLMTDTYPLYELYNCTPMRIIAVEVIPETVCECTGLEDKNGKLIFRDDYCLIMNPCVMAFGVIKYDNACYWFVENKVQADGVRNVIKLCDLEINDFEIQVKSNIHDNPELEV